MNSHVLVFRQPKFGILTEDSAVSLPIKASNTNGASEFANALLAVLNSNKAYFEPNWEISFRYGS